MKHNAQSGHRTPAKLLGKSLLKRIWPFLWFIIWLDRWGFNWRVERALQQALGQNIGKISTKRHRANLLLEILIVLILLILVPIGLLIVLFALGVPVEWFSASRDTVEKTLVNSMTVPIALIGIVIPFLTLAVTHVYASLGLGAIKHAFKHQSFRRLIFSALIVLAGEFAMLTILRLLRTDLIGAEATKMLAGLGNAFVVATAWWTIFLILSATIAISNVIRSFRPDKTLELLAVDLRTESLVALNFELRRNVAFKLLEDLAKDTIWEVPYFRPTQRALVLSPKYGYVSSVSVIGLNLISWYCGKISSPKVNKVQIAKPFTVLTESDAQLASVLYETPVDEHAFGLEHLIRVTYRIKPLQANEPDLLMEAYDQYEEATLTFVRRDNESLLRRALDGYALIIRDYLATGIRLRADDFPNALSDWRPFILLDGSLREVIGLSVTAAEGKHAGLVAHWIRSQMDECVESRDEYTFSRLLNQFLTMHHYSKQANHLVGLNRAYFEPLQILDYTLFRFGKTENISSALVQFHVRLATLTMKHLVTLLKVSITDRDVPKTAEFLRMIRPGELLGHFHPELGMEEFEISVELRDSHISAARRAVLEDLQSAHQVVNEFERNVSVWYVDILHGAVQYMLDRVLYRTSTIEESKGLIEVFLAGMGGIDETASWLNRYNHANAVFETRMWEYWPESRRGQSKNPLLAPSFVFALRALIVQKLSETEIVLQSSRTIDGWRNQLENAIDTILSEKEWESITRGADRAVGEKVKSAIGKSVRQYRQEVAATVREAQLSERLVGDFRKKVTEAFNKRLTLPIAFAVKHNSPLPGGWKSHLIDVNLPPSRYPKEAFIEQDRISVGGFGDTEGYELAIGVDRFIWTKIAENIPPRSSTNFVGKVEPTLEAMIEQVSLEERANLVFIIASRRLFRYEFWDNPKFKAAWQLGGEKLAGLHGEYDGVPVFEVSMPSQESVLVLDRRDIGILPQIELTSVVRELTQSERDELLKVVKNSSEESLREEVLVHVRVAFDLRLAEKPRSRLLRPSDLKAVEDQED